jgi:hypothetical protein
MNARSDEMKNKIVRMMIGLVFGFLFSILTYQTVSAYTCLTQETDCNAGSSIASWTASNAVSYVRSAHREPYQLGGGWWNPNQAQDPYHSVKGYEGPDCSGLVFKSWAMSYSAGVTSYWSWNKIHDVHGPYQATSFYGGCSGACRTLCGSSTGNCSGYTLSPGDAFVGLKANLGFDNHIVMITSRTSGGGYYVVDSNFNGCDINGKCYNGWRETTSGRANYQSTNGVKGIRRNPW